MIKNIIRVTLSNITSIISGVLVGFLIPKILSVEDYGYYKTFMLYVSYLGICSFGIIDGIVLKYGAKDYEELDTRKFRAYFRWYLIIHVCIALFLIISSVLFQDRNYSTICILLGMNLIAVNLTGYFQQISQITQRFKEYSIRKILQSAFNVIFVLLLFALYIKGIEINYLVYSIGIILINYLLVCWYIYTYRNIIFGEASTFRDTKFDILGLMRIGFPLLVANLCSTLIVTLDRQFVNLLFSTNDYAVYAFAYSMLSLVTTATSAVSTVLYPMLKRLNEEEFKRNYDLFLSTVTVFVFGLVLVYFPLTIFVNWFLPKYQVSLEIFRIIIPGIAISSSITVLMHNYYKTLQLNIIYFRKSVFILIFSAVANICAYKMCGTMQSISMASVLTIIFWYIFVDAGLKKVCISNTFKNVSYIIINLIAFYCSSALPNVFLGITAYFVSYLVIAILFYKENLKYLFKQKRRKEA